MFRSEKLVQMAFQCLQLVVTDYLPAVGSAHLEVVVEVAARFGLQTQELNVSLTAIGLLVSKEIHISVKFTALICW